MKFSNRVRSRADFIKVCNLLGKIIVSSDKMCGLNINVLGAFKTKKSFAADVLVHVMDDNRSNYDIPVSDKMCFEDIPGGAVKYPATSFISYRGKETLVRFIRDNDHHRERSIDKPEINIYAPALPWERTREDADIVIETGECQENSLFLLKGKIMSDALKTSRTLEILRHMMYCDQRVKDSYLSKSPPAFSP